MLRSDAEGCPLGVKQWAGICPRGQFSLPPLHHLLMEVVHRLRHCATMYTTHFPSMNQQFRTTSEAGLVVLDIFVLLPFCPVLGMCRFLQVAHQSTSCRPLACIACHSLPSSFAPLPSSTAASSDAASSACRRRCVTPDSTIPPRRTTAPPPHPSSVRSSWSQQPWRER